LLVKRFVLKGKSAKEDLAVFLVLFKQNCTGFNVLVTCQRTYSIEKG